MDLRKLPPSMILALGLACGDDNSCLVETSATTNPNTATMSACLDIGPCLSTTGSTPSTSTGTGMTDDSTGEVSTGPCLSETTAPPPTTGSGTDTGQDTEGDTGTTGMMAEPPPSRVEAVERVLERGALPADVAERLRRTIES